MGGADKNVDMKELEFEKRFDIASAMMHTCLDNHIPIISASITVLNIKHGGRAIHEPGFVLVAADGYITDVDLAMTPSGSGVEVKETVKLKFKSIVITYLKKVGKDNLPTNPFTYTAPKEVGGFGSRDMPNSVAEAYLLILRSSMVPGHRRSGAHSFQRADRARRMELEPQARG